MIQIKKYVNGRFVNVETREYLNRIAIKELIESGEKITVMESKSGKDITSELIAELAPEEKKSESKSTNQIKRVAQLLQKSGDTIFDYAKKSISMWQSFLTMAEDEIEKLVNILVKDKKISKAEGTRLKDEILTYATDFKKWLGENIDQRINEILNAMNLVNKAEIAKLTEEIQALSKKFEELEKTKAPAAKAKKTSKKS